MLSDKEIIQRYIDGESVGRVALALYDVGRSDKDLIESYAHVYEALRSRIRVLEEHIKTCKECHC